MSNNIVAEFSRLGFDYHKMLKKELRLRKNYLIISLAINSNNNKDQQVQDTVYIDFGIHCKAKEPSSIKNISVTLSRANSHAEEEEILYFRYYTQQEGLPTENEILNQIKRFYKVIEINQTTCPPKKHSKTTDSDSNYKKV